MPDTGAGMLQPRNIGHAHQARSRAIEIHVAGYGKARPTANSRNASRRLSTCVVGRTGAGAVERAELPTPVAALIDRGRCAAVAACRRSAVSSTRRGRPRIVRQASSQCRWRGCSADWRTPTAFSALLREELESLLDEVLVELEGSAVAGVRVDHQLVVRQTSGHVEGVRGRQHPVVVAVGEEHGLADA
jgi:hypothetical protein